MTPYDYDADTSRFCDHGYSTKDDAPCPTCADMAIDYAVYARIEEQAIRAQENRIERQYANGFERGVAIF